MFMVFTFINRFRAILRFEFTSIGGVFVAVGRIQGFL